MGLGVLAVFGADQSFKAIEEIEGCERGDNRFTGAPGDDGKGELSVTALDMFENFRDRLQSVEVVLIEGLPAFDDFGDGHSQAVFLVKPGHDLSHRHTGPGIE